MLQDFTSSMEDTIVAVSTPRGNAPLAITRLSGPRAIDICRKVFHGTSGLYRSYTAETGNVILPGGVTLPATLYVMRAPSSYTREDVVELHTVGAVPVLELLLETLIHAGAQPAGPGEFTRRAFVNGRIDLARAEAVMDVIRASDEVELRAAQTALRGERSANLMSLRRKMLELLARVEVDLDFDEDEIGEMEPGELEVALDEIETTLLDMTGAPSRLHDRGALRAVLFGLPNAGKSSLLNMLAGRECAVTSKQPGTTRDPVTAEIRYRQIPIILIDPAGVAAGPGEGGIAGKARDSALKEMEQADILIFVHDVTQDVTQEEARLFDSGKPTILALNKTDLKGRGSVPESWTVMPRVETSCVLGTGRENLLDSILDLLMEGSVYLTFDRGHVSARHQRHIAEALSAVRNIRRCGPETAGADERIAFELREGLDHIGRIVGEVTSDDILDIIFSSFCIGK